MKRTLSIAVSALLAVSLGIAFEWVMLTGSSPQAVASAVVQSLPTPVVHYARPDFQTGVVFPRWGTTAYSSLDPNYGIGLSEIQQQTGARWIELTVNFYQPAYNSLYLTPNPSTPTPASLEAGIREARARGYRVFVVPMITVGENGWAGIIHFHTSADTITWFHNYWKVLEPYAQAAADAGADQFAIGTEYFTLETVAPAQWQQLIDNAHAIFPGTLTYDMNFTSLEVPVRSWMRDPNLSYIGVSEYQALTRYSQWLDPASLSERWNTAILPGINLFAAEVGKPIVLSEIGYRNRADALFQPWEHSSNAPPDPTEQAAAYNAALTNVISDPYIEGVFFWGWSIPVFEPNWLPAARVLHQWYTSPQS